MPGSLSCVCGAVCIVLHHPVPRFRLECGCCDCRQALQWAQLQGGPVAPALPDLWYFANDFTITRGRDNIRLYKLRDNGMSIRMVATCCYSTLLVDNPHYQKNGVMVMAQGVKMDVESMKKQWRIQMKDFPRERLGELKPFNGKAVDMDNLDVWGDNSNPQEAFAAFGAVTAMIDERKGISFQDITEASTVEVLGLQHYKELV